MAETPADIFERLNRLSTEDLIKLSNEYSVADVRCWPVNALMLMRVMQKRLGGGDKS